MRVTYFEVALFFSAMQVYADRWRHSVLTEIIAVRRSNFSALLYGAVMEARTVARY